MRKFMTYALLLNVLYLFSGSQQLFAQSDLLCQGSYWTEDEGNQMMKQFASQWSDKASWEKRADIIRNGIIKGLRIEEMPKENFPFKPIIHSSKEMDGYTIPLKRWMVIP